MALGLNRFRQGGKKLIAATAIIDNHHEEQNMTQKYRDSIAVKRFAHE